MILYAIQQLARLKCIKIFFNRTREGGKGKLKKTHAQTIATGQRLFYKQSALSSRKLRNVFKLIGHILLS